MATENIRSAAVVVQNKNEWMGNPRFGIFSVYLDGKRVGAVPLGQSLEVPTSAGSHTLRVRQWWYLSPRLAVSLADGETAHFDADIPRQLSVPARMMRLLFRPFNSLSLTRA